MALSWCAYVFLSCRPGGVGELKRSKKSGMEVAEELHGTGRNYRKPHFWTQCHDAGAEGSLCADGSPVRLLIWRMKADQGWLGKEYQQGGGGGWEEMGEAGAGGRQDAAQAVGVCLLSAFALPRTRALLENLSLAADQHKITSQYC